MLSYQRNAIGNCVDLLKTIKDQEQIEDILNKTLEQASDDIAPDNQDYYSVLNAHLYHHILSCYKHKKDNICLWRFIKKLSDDQLTSDTSDYPLQMLDALMRIYFYSDPLDDLTCVFIPVADSEWIPKYLNWIKHYFYNANYPTSLLWLYALDSALDCLFPNEIIYLGRRIESQEPNIMIPDLSYPDTVLIKRFSDKPDDYCVLKGKDANNEFRQIFTSLYQEYQDRCLSWSGKQEENADSDEYRREWGKFEDILKFGVSDKAEKGCVSFSDMRSSTEVLTTYGKSVYLNKIQQPFFEKTKLISKKYKGRIDKFMGDNVMSVFLSHCMMLKHSSEKELHVVSDAFFALFELCKILYDLIVTGDFERSGLGLRSGVTYGHCILRSNLGNEILRDFTVTGETVNLAARLEHLTIRELIVHNRMYFERAVEKYPQIKELVYSYGGYENLNEENKNIIREFTIYQNMVSNLEKLEKIRFDIRMNQAFYFKMRDYLENKGFYCLNKDSAEMHGFEAYNVEGFDMKFYFSYYNPKGFGKFEKIWMLPLETDILVNLDIEKLRDGR